MVFKPQTFYGADASTTDLEANPGAATETRVAEALARAGDLDASNVTVTALGAEIVLRGTVIYPEEVAIAGDIASRISGVTGVRNFISTTRADKRARFA